MDHSKSAKKDLSEAEEKSRNLIESVPIGFIEFDLKNKRLLYINQILIGLIGYSRENLSYEEFFKNIIHPEDITKLLSSSLENTLEFRMIKKSREIIWLNGSSVKIFDNDGNMIKLSFWLQDITEIKQFEEKIKHENSLLNKIFNTSLATYVTDLNCNIIMVNDRFCHLFQINKSEMINEKCYDVWKGPLCNTQECSLKQVLNGNEDYQYEMNKYLKDGTNITCIVHNFPHKDQKGKVVGIIKNFIDITERKNSELLLREKERKLSESESQLKERIKEINCIYNLSNLIEEPNVTIEYLLESLTFLIPPAMQFPEITWVKIKLNEYVFKTANYKETEYKIISSNIFDKQEFLIEIGYLEDREFLQEEYDFVGEIEYKIRIFMEQKEKEEEIRKSEEKHTAILRNIKEGYYEIDLKGNYTFINNGFCEITEYPKNEILGNNYKMFMDEKTIRSVYKEFNEVFNTEIGKKEVQFELNTKNGLILNVESSVGLKYDAIGNKMGFFGILRDITQRKKMEEFMEELNEFMEEEVQKRTGELQELIKEKDLYLEELLKSSQFKNQFLATMSHELRTPLNAIIGFTDLILEDRFGPITELQREYIEDIKSSADHQFQMIKKILDISKIESGKINLNKNYFSLKSTINQVISNFRLKLEKKNLKIVIEGLENDYKIFADPIRFKEIYFNLISNAIKYTIEGEIKLIFKENINDWIFKVKDTGIGIDEKDFDIIFKEFKRVNSPYVQSIPGTGLGLSFIKRLINLHGGNIEFESKIGVGSTFTFKIPK